MKAMHWGTLLTRWLKRAFEKKQAWSLQPSAKQECPDFYTWDPSKPPVYKKVRPSLSDPTPVRSDARAWTWEERLDGEWQVREWIQSHWLPTNRHWKQLVRFLHTIDDPKLAVQVLHWFRKWSIQHPPERFQNAMSRMLQLHKWWDALPSSPWHEVARVLTLSVQEKPALELQPLLIPLLKSRSPVVRERAARTLCKLGWRPEHRKETAVYVVAVRRLKAVAHLSNKIPAVLRQAMPAERFCAFKDGTWVFVPEHVPLSDVEFALDALPLVPFRTGTLELLLEICACCPAQREKALKVLTQVPQDPELWLQKGVQVRLQVLLTTWHLGLGDDLRARIQADFLPV